MMKPSEPGTRLYIDLMKKTLSASIYDESTWLVMAKQANDSNNPVKLLFVLMRNKIIQFLQKRSILLVKTRAYDAARRDEGTDWPLFGFTMIGHKRLNNLQACIEDVLKNNVPGDFIETGAWRGGATIFMRAMLKAYNIADRKVWVADSFEGMPLPLNKDDGWDYSKEHTLNVSLEMVQANFAKFDLLDDQVVFLKGWFKDSLPKAPIDKLAILRLDGDMYSSTMDSLDNLYHKVSKGGYIIIDDYYSWPACQRAVSDFLLKHTISANIKAIDGSSVFWKCE